jgi:hypothetical protein
MREVDMMTSGWMLFGVLFCLLGTVALVAIAVVGLRWFVDQGHGPETRSPAPSVQGPVTERAG